MGPTMKTRRDILLKLRKHEDGTYYLNVDPEVVRYLGLKVGTFVAATLYSTNNPQDQAAPEPPDEIMVMVQAKTNCVPDRASEQASALARKLGVGVVLLFSPEATVLARCNPDS